jgi:hypothetical protein
MTENREKKHCPCHDQKDADIKQYFEYSYKFIIFAFVVSFITMLLSKQDHIRLILFIEILITGISGYMYYLFTQSMKQKEGELDLKYIDKLRYNGWSFSTPLMMSVLCLVLSASTNIPLKTRTLITVIALDYLMLFFGYLGELGNIDRVTAAVLGFIPFFAMFYVVFTTFILKYNLFNYLVFFIYFILWSGYGVAYLLDEPTKNIVTNFLDVTAKGVFAVGLSIYYTFFV